eukprot:3163955-Rhodomonas_salina.4
MLRGRRCGLPSGCPLRKKATVELVTTTASWERPGPERTTQPRNQTRDAACLEHACAAFVMSSEYDTRRQPGNALRNQRRIAAFLAQTALKRGGCEWSVKGASSEAFERGATHKLSGVEPAPAREGALGGERLAEEASAPLHPVRQLDPGGEREVGEADRRVDGEEKLRRHQLRHLRLDDHPLRVSTSESARQLLVRSMPRRRLDPESC